MVEALYRVPLADVLKVRLVCRRCGTAVEYPVDKVERATDKRPCPGCNNDLRPAGPDRDDSLYQLAAAVRDLRKSTLVAIEFVIPGPAEAAAPARRAGAP